MSQVRNRVPKGLTATWAKVLFKTYPSLLILLLHHRKVGGVVATATARRRRVFPQTSGRSDRLRQLQWKIKISYNIIQAAAATCGQGSVESKDRIPPLEN